VREEGEMRCPARDGTDLGTWNVSLGMSDEGKEWNRIECNQNSPHPSYSASF